MRSAPDREEGWDLARAAAIVLMILINFQVFLLARPSGAPEEVALRWLAHVPGGRSSSLFVTLAGAGIALMSRRARESGALWPVRRALLLRALFLLVAGNLLIQVWSIDILHFYAFYLALAAIFALGASERVLLGAAGAIVLTAAIGAVALHGAPEIDHPYLSPIGMALDVFATGIHPVIPWMAFVLFGMWLGRQELSRPERRRTLFVRAAIAWTATELLATAAGVLATTTLVPKELRLAVELTTTRWSPSPLYMIAAASTATLAITLAHEVVARSGSTRIVRALVATGQLSLSIYLLHALVGVGVPRWALHLENGVPVLPLVGYWAAFVILVVIGSALYRARFRRGPIEAVMRWITRSRGEPAVERDPVPLERAPLPIAAVAAAAVVLAAIRVVGVVPPRVECGEPVEIEVPARVAGELTLVCPHARAIVTVPRAMHVTISGSSGADTFLELREGDRLLLDDDDSGPGLDPFLIKKLPAGRYEILLRPYSGDPAPFLLLVSEAAPKLRSPT